MFYTSIWCVHPFPPSFFSFLSIGVTNIHLGNIGQHMIKLLKFVSTIMSTLVLIFFTLIFFSYGALDSWQPCQGFGKIYHEL